MKASPWLHYKWVGAVSVQAGGVGSGLKVTEPLKPVHHQGNVPIYTTLYTDYTLHYMYYILYYSECLFNAVSPVTPIIKGSSRGPLQLRLLTSAVKSADSIIYIHHNISVYNMTKKIKVIQASYTGKVITISQYHALLVRQYVHDYLQCQTGTTCSFYLACS